MAVPYVVTIEADVPVRVSPSVAVTVAEVFEAVWVVNVTVATPDVFVEVCAELPHAGVEPRNQSEPQLQDLDLVEDDVLADPQAPGLAAEDDRRLEGVPRLRRPPAPQ